MLASVKRCFHVTRLLRVTSWTALGVPRGVGLLHVVEEQVDARRNPLDPPSPLIGEELAVARALQDLAAQLIEAAQVKIEDFSG